MKGDAGGMCGECVKSIETKGKGCLAAYFRDVKSRDLGAVVSTLETGNGSRSRATRRYGRVRARR